MTSDSRIEALEKQVRALKRMLFGGVGAVVVGGLLAATHIQTVPDVIRAKKFEVVSEKGHGIITLGERAHGGVISVFTHDGKPRIEIASDEHAGALGVLNDDGNVVVALGAQPEGGALAICDKHAKTVVALAAAGDDAGLVVRNGEGTGVVAIGVDKQSGGIINTFNSKDKRTSKLP